MRFAAPLFVLAILLTTPAFALPPIPEYLKEVLAGDDANKPFVATFTELKMKCSVCHVPGKDKKAKGHGLNDFGEAMHKHLDHKGVTAAHKAKARATAVKLLSEAWAKSVEMKNAEGKPYSEAIHAGKLPGKNE